MICSRCHKDIDSGVDRCDCTEEQLAEWRNTRMAQVDDAEKPKPGVDVPNYGAEAVREDNVERVMRGLAARPPRPDNVVACVVCDYKGPPPCYCEKGDGLSDDPVGQALADAGFTDEELAPPPAPSARQPAPAGANAYQPGGNHYAAEYQHWDFVVDTGLHYLLGCATKYVSRWRKKGGVLDLEKAAHYLDKAAECDVFPPIGALEQTKRFVEQLEVRERAIIICIMQGNYEAAAMSIQWLAAQAAASE